MNIKPLSLFCPCGLAATRINQVGLTAEYELALNWQCTGCGTNMYVLKTLSDCCRECPEADGVSEFGGERAQRADEEFLHSLGVKFPD
jgi:hypothetical protein